MINLKRTDAGNVSSLLNDVKGSEIEKMGLDLRGIGSSGSKDQKIKRIAVQFEEMMVNSLLKQAFKEKKESGEDEGLLLNSGSYNDLRIMFLSQHISDSGGLGYQEIIEQQIKDHLKQSGQDKTQDNTQNNTQNNTTDISQTQKIAASSSKKQLEPIKIDQLIKRDPIMSNSETNNTNNTDSNDLASVLSGAGKDVEQVSKLKQQLKSTESKSIYELGDITEPVSGRVTSDFGWRQDPLDGKTRFHAGVDYRAAPHTPVKSFMAGEVVFSGWKQGYGRLVEIRHDGGYVTRYGHNAELLVKKGDVVKSGDVVSLSGSSGRSTGPHLHFEVRKGDLALDPERILKTAERYMLAKK